MLLIRHLQIVEIKNMDNIGYLDTGKELSFDELKAILIKQTRLGSKRPLKNRTLAELTADVNAFIVSHVAKGTKRDHETNNLKVQLAACQEYIERQNIEINQLRKAYAATGIVSRQD
jgi:hypothetical protein